jgi:hypothetical protein
MNIIHSIDVHAHEKKSADFSKKIRKYFDSIIRGIVREEHWYRFLLTTASAMPRKYPHSACIQWGMKEFNAIYLFIVLAHI